MDYDVAAASLASPPASAPVQSYRPSVAVQNLGIHPATVTGTLRIYDRDAGTLLDTMALTSTEVPVGTTRNALGDKLWEPVPADIGRAFLFIATVDWPPDQYLPNNNLGPITVTVTAAPPPPPPPVEAHASQHEEGGGDEIDVDGLTGKLAEPQTPTEHASNHEYGGEDQLNVDNLAGELADSQKPKPHHASHEEGGTDPITGIPPAQHGAALHDETVEATANKGAPNGYAPLDADARVPAFNLGGAPIAPPNSLQTDLEGKVTWDTPPVPPGVELLANKDTELGYCPLDGSALVPSANLAPGASGGLFLKGDQTWATPTAAVHGNELHDPDLQDVAEKDTANGYAGLDANGLLKSAELPPVVERTSSKGEPNGYAGLDADSRVPADNLTIHDNDEHLQNYAPVEMLEDYQPTAAKDQAGGYCGLDATAVVIAARLAVQAGSEGQVLTNNGAGGQSWEDVVAPPPELAARTAIFLASSLPGGQVEVPVDPSWTEIASTVPLTGIDPDIRDVFACADLYGVTPQAHALPYQLEVMVKVLDTSANEIHNIAIQYDDWPYPNSTRPFHVSVSGTLLAATASIKVLARVVSGPGSIFLTCSHIFGLGQIPLPS